MTVNVNRCQQMTSFEKWFSVFHQPVSVSGTPETTVAEPISLNPGDFWDNLRIIQLEGQNFIDYLGTNFINGWLAPI